MKKLLVIFGFILSLAVRSAWSEEPADDAVSVAEARQIEEQVAVPADETLAEDTISESENNTLGMAIAEDGSINFIGKNENGEVIEVPLTVEQVIHTGYDQLGEIKKLVLEKEEDDLYADSEVQPLNKEMSNEERQNENSTELTNLFDEKKLPELLCSDIGLKKQVEQYIYQNINKHTTRSVVEKRLRVLLVKNLKDFDEITAEEVTGKNKFEALAAIMELKVNRVIPIYRICASKGNDYSKFESVYVIIYADQDYYKVVVANLIPTSDQIDEATFIYNWQ